MLNKPTKFNFTFINPNNYNNEKKSIHQTICASLDGGG